MKPLILITNDDGINSYGLKAAVLAVIDFADVLVVAPHSQQTGLSRAIITSEKDSGVIDELVLDLGDRQIKAYGVHGTPAASVLHAMMELTQRKVDLCISGINYGENLGLDLTLSGTVGAVIQANCFGVPGLAVSQEVDLEHLYSLDFNGDFEVSKNTIKYFAQKILNEGLDEDISFLNINVPYNATMNTELLLTQQSKSPYFRILDFPKRDFKQRAEYKVDKVVEEKLLDKKDDIFCVTKLKKISITPITWNMTSEVKYNI